MLCSWRKNYSHEQNNVSGPQTAEPEQTIDYNFAQQELMMKEFSNDPIQEAISAVEKQYEEDKQGKVKKRPRNTTVRGGWYR